MYVSRINLDKSLGEDDPHTEMDVLPSKQETAIYTPPPKKKKKLLCHKFNFINGNLWELRHKQSNSRPSLCKKISVCIGKINLFENFKNEVINNLNFLALLFLKVQ